MIAAARLANQADWQWLLLILGAAVVGKMLPVLMELIVLNIGYDLGFIPPNMFTILVIMAIVTTLMTRPLLRRWLPKAGYVIPVGIEA